MRPLLLGRRGPRFGERVDRWVLRDKLTDRAGHLSAEVNFMDY